MSDIRVALGCRLFYGARVLLLWTPQLGSSVVQGMLVSSHLGSLAVMDSNGRVTIPPRWCVIAADSETGRELQNAASK